MTKLRAGLSALLLALLSTWLLVLPAQADDSAPITNYDVKVNLTPEGVALTQQAEKTAAQLEQDATSRLTAAERKTLIRLLQKIY